MPLAGVILSVLTTHAKDVTCLVGLVSAWCLLLSCNRFTAQLETETVTGRNKERQKRDPTGAIEAYQLSTIEIVIFPDTYNSEVSWVGH